MTGDEAQKPAARGGIRGLRWAARARLAEHRAYLPVARARYPGKVVGEDTELVIDGFTRSGVTFAVMAFQLAQARPVRLAHHLHAPAQLIEAVRRGVPVMLVIRGPEEAVLSAMIREPYLSARAGLVAYGRFHRRVVPLLGDMVVARFEEVTTDLGGVIDRVNQRFGTSFDPFVHDAAAEAEVFDIIEDRSRRPPWAAELGRYESGLLGIEGYRQAVEAHGGREGLVALPEHRVPRPSDARRTMKDDLRPAIRNERRALARADRAYRAVVEARG